MHVTGDMILALDELRTDVRKGRNSPPAADFSMEKLIEEYAAKGEKRP